MTSNMTPGVTPRMTPRQKRIGAVVLIIMGMGIAALLILTAFEKNLMYFYTPSEVAQGEVPTDRKFRIGGMVVDGSVVRNDDSLAVQFDLTDTAHIVTVEYDGILPDLFREGQGIVANGSLSVDGRFIAAEVLAKHDENYMPPEVAEALAKAKPTTPPPNANSKY
jgi:cytochrome c-type biogenesis protein CcmE